MKFMEKIKISSSHNKEHVSHNVSTSLRFTTLLIMSSATITEITDENTFTNNESAAPPPTRNEQIKITLGLLTPWIEKGALKGAFSLDEGYTIFLSLHLLQADPCSTIQLAKGQMKRLDAGKNIFQACSLIQTKGGVFGDLEQTSKVVEIVSVLCSLLQEEDQEMMKNELSTNAKRISETDLIPADVRALQEADFSSRISILQNVIQSGQTKGVVPFEMVHNLFLSLKVLSQGPRSRLQQQDGKTLMEPLQAFQIITEALKEIVSRGNVLQLIELVQVRMVVTYLKEEFLKLLREDAAAQKASSLESDARGKKRTKVDAILNDENIEMC